MQFLAQRLNRYQSAILMGDLNCEPDASEFNYLLTHTALEHPSDYPRTFPSWRPQRRLDHILATNDLTVKHLRTIPFVCSDHLPVIAEIYTKEFKRDLRFGPAPHMQSASCNP